jgi:hypothetical protein
MTWLELALGVWLGVFAAKLSMVVFNSLLTAWVLKKQRKALSRVDPKFANDFIDRFEQATKGMKGGKSGG